MTYFVTVKEKPESCEECVFNCVNRYECPLKELPPRLPKIKGEKEIYTAKREAWNTVLDYFEENAH